jgi:hypothetical protein
VGCLQKLINLVVALLVLVALAGAGMYYFLLPELDTKLADAVRREFILPPSSSVIIDRGSLADTLEGQVRRFRVTSAEAKIDGVAVEDLKFEAKGIRFDLPQTLATGNAELMDVDYGELECRISEAAIEERWAAELEKRGLKKVEVELKDDRVKLSGVIDVMGFETRASARGQLVADGTERVKFKSTEIDLGKLNLEVKKFGVAFDSLTPVIDVGQFKLAVLIDQLKAEKGYLVIRARSRGLAERLAEGEQEREDERRRLDHEEETLRKQLEDIQKAKSEVDKADSKAQEKADEPSGQAGQPDSREDSGSDH